MYKHTKQVTVNRSCGVSVHKPLLLLDLINHGAVCHGRGLATQKLLIVHQMRQMLDFASGE